MRDADNAALLDHCRRVADIIPVVGFYLQPAVGGRPLDRHFWRGFLDIDRVVAIKSRRSIAIARWTSPRRWLKAVATTSRSTRETTTRSWRIC